MGLVNDARFKNQALLSDVRVEQVDVQKNSVVLSLNVIAAGTYSIAVGVLGDRDAQYFSTFNKNCCLVRSITARTPGKQIVKFDFMMSHQDFGVGVFQGVDSVPYGKVSLPIRLISSDEPVCPLGLLVDSPKRQADHLPSFLSDSVMGCQVEKPRIRKSSQISRFGSNFGKDTAVHKESSSTVVDKVKHTRVGSSFRSLSVRVACGVTVSGLLIFAFVWQLYGSSLYGVATYGRQESPNSQRGAEASGHEGAYYNVLIEGGLDQDQSRHVARETDRFVTHSLESSGRLPQASQWSDFEYEYAKKRFREAGLSESEAAKEARRVIRFVDSVEGR